jgi:hypothetical protein
MEYQDEIYARLEATNRECDGCGVRIGRFTDKCAYDPVHDQIYCSTGGCAVEYRAGPDCVTCGNKINRLLEDPSETEKGFQCEACGNLSTEATPVSVIEVVSASPKAEKLGEAVTEAIQETKTKAKQKVEEIKAVVAPWPDDAVFKMTLREFVDKGPFAVLRLPYIHQVVVKETISSGEPKVMATNSSPVGAFKLAAQLTLKYADGEIPETNK